ncbi:hypothetical protein SDC9_187757 [bioreactor metagenome]|uniref:Uncharacterized protein n=1 Tax=bioreactor metagenome TaxID=1076179 RepID=A0A645HMD5_9ZZZZ
MLGQQDRGAGRPPASERQQCAGPVGTHVAHVDIGEPDVRQGQHPVDVGTGPDRVGERQRRQRRADPALGPPGGQQRADGAFGGEQPGQPGTVPGGELTGRPAESFDVRIAVLGGR